MPAITEPLRLISLNNKLRKASEIGAEVKLPSTMTLLDLGSPSEVDINTLGHGLYSNNVLVIQNQAGISPTVLLRLGKLFDDTAWDMHSGGSEAMKYFKKPWLRIARRGYLAHLRSR